MFKRFRERRAAHRILNLEMDSPEEFDLYVALGVTRVLADHGIGAHSTEPILLAAIDQARAERLRRATWGSS